VDDEAAGGDIDHPIFDDPGAGVELGFGGEIETQGCI